MTENLESTPSLPELAHRICEINEEAIEDLRKLTLHPTVQEALIAILDLNSMYVRKITESYLGVGDKIEEITKKFAPK